MVDWTSSKAFRVRRRSKTCTAARPKATAAALCKCVFVIVLKGVLDVAVPPSRR